MSFIFLDSFCTISSNLSSLCNICLNIYLRGRMSAYVSFIISEQVLLYYHLSFLLIPFSFPSYRVPLLFSLIHFSKLIGSIIPFYRVNMLMSHVALQRTHVLRFVGKALLSVYFLRPYWNISRVVILRENSYIIDDIS
jgi:hypothetical protein